MRIAVDLPFSNGLITHANVGSYVTQKKFLSSVFGVDIYVKLKKHQYNLLTFNFNVLNFNVLFISMCF